MDLRFPVPSRALPNRIWRSCAAAGSARSGPGPSARPRSPSPARPRRHGPETAAGARCSLVHRPRPAPGVDARPASRADRSGLSGRTTMAHARRRTCSLLNRSGRRDGHELAEKAKSPRRQPEASSQSGLHHPTRTTAGDGSRSGQRVQCAVRTRAPALATGPSRDARLQSPDPQHAAAAAGAPERPDAAARRGSSIGKRNSSARNGCGNGGTPPPFAYRRRIDELGPLEKRSKQYRHQFRRAVAFLAYDAASCTRSTSPSPTSCSTSPTAAPGTTERLRRGSPLGCPRDATAGQSPSASPATRWIVSVPPGWSTGITARLRTSTTRSGGPCWTGAGKALRRTGS